MDLLPGRDTMIVMSDHGARPMMGGICFSDWPSIEQATSC